MILENGSEERSHVATQAQPRAGRPQAEGSRRVLGEGMELPEGIKQLEVSEQLYYRWRNQFGGMKANDVKRRKELEAENARLKRVVADRVLENQALREVASGNWGEPVATSPSGPHVAVSAWYIGAAGVPVCRTGPLDAAA
jgi:putative transposase